MIKKFIRKHPFGSYYILAVFFAVFANLWLYIFLPDWSARMRPRPFGLNHFSILVPLSLIVVAPQAFLGLLFPSAPSVSAIIISGLTAGKEAIKRLFGRFKPWREGVTAKEALKWYAIIVFGWIVIMTIQLIYYSNTNPEIYDKAVKGLRLEAPALAIIFLFMGMFTETGCLLEELGWRGYALPLLMDRMKTPLHATVLLGFLWGFWHFPREVPALIAGAPIEPFLIRQLAFHVGTISGSIIITFFFNRVGGSVIPAIMIHGLGNYVFEMIREPVFIGFSFYGIAKIIIAALIIALTGTALGRRPSE